MSEAIYATLTADSGSVGGRINFPVKIGSLEAESNARQAYSSTAMTSTYYSAVLPKKSWRTKRYHNDVKPSHRDLARKRKVARKNKKAGRR